MPVTQESHRVAKFKTKQHRELDAAIRDIANIIALVNTNEAAIAAIPAADGELLAYITQTGTGAPSYASTKKNTTGTTWNLARTGVGVYTISSVGIVDWRDVFVIIAGNGSQSAQLEVASVADAGDGTCLITINNFNHGTGPVDEITHAALMIKVAA